MSIFESTATSTNSPKIHIDTTAGRLSSMESSEGPRWFKVKLDKPFNIPIEKLYVPVESGKTSANVTWRRSMPARYEMLVEVKCLDLEDSGEFLALVENRSSSDYHGPLGGNESVLSATWQKLPNCPSEGELLNISRMQAHKRLTDFDYGMSLSVGWSRKRDSPLARFNRLRQYNTKRQQDQLPTPSASEDSDRHTSRYVVKYAFQMQEERYHTVYGLSCPICSAIRATPEYPTFARLYLHLMTWHDHFRPQAVKSDRASEYERGSEMHHTIWLWPVEKPTDPTQELSEGEEDVWVAPSEPFDQSAYLTDQDKWTSHVPSKASKKVIGRRKRDVEIVANKLEQIPKAPKRIVVNDAPPKISRAVDLNSPTAPQRRKYRLPAVPGVRFYRTVSKRPFLQDEDLIESDDDLDESWLHERLHDDLKYLNVSPGAQEFIEDFNAFVGTGAFATSDLLQGGIISFTRKHKEKTRDKEWRAAYKDRLRILLNHRIVERDAVKRCMALMKGRAAAEAPTTAASSALSGASAKEVLLGRTDSGTARSEEGHDLPRDLCICGERADSGHGTLMCDGEDCVRLRFHMECVKVDRRVDGWMCGDCAPQA